MTVQEYGEKIAELVVEGDWPRIEPEIHGINLPDRWQEKIKPIFDDLKGRNVEVKVIPFSKLSDLSLHWLKMAPAEILERTKNAVTIAYSDGDGENSGSIDLAVYERDGRCSILMVGG